MVTLPHVLFVILLELAAGGFFALLLTDQRDRIPPGFRAFTGCIFLISGVLALWILVSIPVVDEPSSGGRSLLLASLWTAILGMALYSALSWSNRRRIRLAFGWAAFTTATVATGLSAAGVAFGVNVGLVALLAFATGAAAMGAAMTGMLLGHWYLVTPSLPVRPLLRVVGLLIAVQVLQALLIPMLLVVSTNSGEVLAGFAAALFWLRVTVGIAFPIVLSVLTWQCCRSRSLQSATGLLYIAVACVVSGEIAAKSLFFLTGVPL